MLSIARIALAGALWLALSPVASAQDPYALVCEPVPAVSVQNDGYCETSIGAPGKRLVFDPVLRIRVPDLSSVSLVFGDPPELITCVDTGVTVPDLSMPRRCICQPDGFMAEPEAVDCPPR